jgi:hypothetical protein
MFGLEDTGHPPTELPHNDHDVGLFTGAIKIMLDEVRVL